MEHGRFEYSADRAAAKVGASARRARRRVDHAECRAFSLRQAGDVDDADDRRFAARRAQLRLARLRRARRHLAADGHPRPAGLCRDRRAQFRSLSCTIRRSSRPATNSVGSGWRTARTIRSLFTGMPEDAETTASSRACSTRLRAAPGKKRARLARARADRDRHHARPAGRSRHRVRRRLVQRRAALHDEDAQRLDRRAALHARDRRHPGVPATAARAKISRA